jgi:hypothetical protein
MLHSTNCSNKKIFFFSKNTGSFSTFNNADKGRWLPDSAQLLTFTTKLEESSASSSSKGIVLTLPVKPEPLISMDASKSNLKPPSLQNETHEFNTARQGENKKNKLHPKKLQDSPENIKPVNKKAKTGLVFSILSVALLVLGVVIPPIPFILAGLAAIGGMAFSLVSMSQINQNPERLSGKATARAGLIISSIVLGFFLIGVLYILAFAGG